MKVQETSLRTIKFNPAEKLTLIYILITGIVACYLWITKGKGVELIGIRLAIGSVIFGMTSFENSGKRNSNQANAY